jgi:hypothetical protein
MTFVKVPRTPRPAEVSSPRTSTRSMQQRIHRIRSSPSQMDLSPGEVLIGDRSRLHRHTSIKRELERFDNGRGGVRVEDQWHASPA